MQNLVERTDFVSVPVQDMARAKSFYRDVLGMHSPNWDAGFPEIATGNVSLYLVDPTAMGRSSLRTQLTSRCASRTSPRHGPSSKSAA
jgi:catechol 2,3-dioxygenase-like lactoylglutathione lyase family enzyme